MTLARDLAALIARRASLSSALDAAGTDGASRLSGTAGSSGPLAALVIAARRGAPVLAVLPTEDDARSWARDLRVLSDPRPEEPESDKDDLVEGQARTPVHTERESPGLPPLTILQNPPLDVTDEDVSVFDAFSALAERLRVLRELGESTGGTKRVVVATSVAGLLERVPSPETVARASLEIRKGKKLDLGALVSQLVATGLRRLPLVESPGEFAVRGGLVDVFPVGAASPVRIELFGDEVESLRSFEPATQRSIEELDRVSVPLIAAPEYVRARREDKATLLDHLPEGSVVLLVDLLRSVEKAVSLDERSAARERGDLEPARALVNKLTRRPRLVLSTGADAEIPSPWRDLLPGSSSSVDLGATSHDATRGAQQEITDGLSRLVRRGERVTVVCLRGAERERLREILEAAGISPDLGARLRAGEASPGVTLTVGSLEGGFAVPEERVLVATSSELLGRYRRIDVTAKRRHRLKGHRAIESFADLEEGEAVVHVTHGVGIFRGLVRLEKEGRPRDHLALEYDEGAILYVPAERIGLVRRYIGPGGAPPRLSKLGSQGWQKRTRSAERAARDLAGDLLSVQAARRVKAGTAFPEDDDWQRAFEASFPWNETDDQVRASEQVKDDMTAPRPMDRLLCGDVGYGKTEVAMRAAFKAASAGKQVAVLVPTTILAMQHAKTFQERMRDYPITVDVVSRFRTQKEQRRAIERAAKGELDILIGTHRLLSKDVTFKDLGLIVIDDEQRFGVEHKERLKALRQTVDVLTLSATPIPRTLHMALSGAKEISALTTPPEGRVAVETKVVRFDRALVRRAIERELAREGQVFFVHDRVQTIERVADLVNELVPYAKVAVAHGQLPEDELEDRMVAFMQGEADVLVSTTIVESGLDIPRANTLIVNRADRFGLADLHQLRGRVGRTRERAFAYFLLPEKTELSETAAKRLRAIEEFDELGAGFRIAMRDLEIRGAGNVLGADQSGHMATIGYDLYCRLLRRAVEEMRGQAEVKSELDLERDLDLEAGELELLLDVAAYVPDNYIDDVALKIECYRKLGTAVAEEELIALRDELRDRYGPLPDVLSALFDLRRLRVRAATIGVERIHRQDRVVVLSIREARGKPGEETPLKRVERALWRKRKALRPIDERTLYLVLDDPGVDDEDVLHLLLRAIDPNPPPVLPTEVKVAPEVVTAGGARRRRRKRHREGRG
ncbi:transcription-repair coupling factor [bacterium]|nr:transcription-repair coupling factor [bacterium]